MSAAIDVLRNVVLAGFAGVAAIVVWQAFRLSGRQRPYLAAALSLFLPIVILGRIGNATNYRYHLLSDLATLTLLASGYCFLLLRHSFLPVSRAWRAAAAALLVGVGGLGIASSVSYAATVRNSRWQSIVAVLIVLAWGAVIAEPVVRFWLVGSTLPPVQRARVRFISVAYAILFGIRLVVAISTGRSQSRTLVLSSLSLLAVILLYVSVMPPAWLRRSLRQKQQEELELSRRLVMFAPDRQTLAARALDWAMRVVGARGGFVAEAGGEILAESGLDDEQIGMYQAHAPDDRATLIRGVHHNELAITVPIAQQDGTGLLVTVSGPFNLVFSSDETTLLQHQADVIGYALDRVVLTEARRKLEETKEQFIANAAHELRTPLASIVGFSELFAGGFDRMEPKDVSEGIAAIVRQGRRMSELVADLLDLTQLEMGKTRIAMKPLDLAPAVEHSIANATPPGGRSVHVDVEPGVRVLADPSRLDQVFTNLLTNAFRHGGPNVSVEAQRANGSVRVVVGDDGNGVPDELRPHLFEPFARGMSPAARDGSGLGLAIVRSLVEAFGGSVSYEPRKPHGASFVVRLVPAN